MFKDLAHEIFVADGGVDDFRTMSDDDLKSIVARTFREWAQDDVLLMLVVREARGL